MIGDILVLIAFLVENCTGVALVQTYENNSTQLDNESYSSLLEEEVSNPLEDFTKYDPEDTIFREYNPPQHLETDPKAWKQSLPTFKTSFWECLKSVLLIQALAGTLIGFVAVLLVFIDFSTVEWCYDEVWNKMPKNVLHLRLTAQCVEGFILQMWNFFCICVIFPLSLIKKLNLMTVSLVIAFMDVVYRLNLQVYGIYSVHWMTIPLNVLFTIGIMINHYLISRSCFPRSLKDTLKTYFVITSQLFLGAPVWFFLVYKIFPFYMEQKEHIKIIVAAGCPLLTLLPKAVSRIGVQNLKKITHPGTAHFMVVITYGISAVVFRVMQAELTSMGMFVALGIAHAIIDLLERITITMRDHIWEYLYRLVRRQTRRQPKYRSPRSRRFIADVSIQIMMQEATALITALGFINVYQFMYSESKSLSNYQLIESFFIRASVGLSIDLVFNTISLLIQNRVMNVAVNRVWKKRWRHHMIVNILIVCISVLYFSEHLFQIVRDKYNSKKHPHLHPHVNCSFPSFL